MLVVTNGITEARMLLAVKNMQPDHVLDWGSQNSLLWVKLGFSVDPPLIVGCCYNPQLALSLSWCIAIAFCRSALCKIVTSGRGLPLYKEVRAQEYTFDIRADDLNTIAAPTLDNNPKP